MAINICPSANRLINPAFYNTLDQSISKHLTVMPQRLKLLTVREGEFDTLLVPTSNFCLKKAIVNYIQTQGEENNEQELSVDIENLKIGLIEKFGDKLFKEEEALTSLAERLKKITSHLNKIINRNSLLFAKCPKTYTCKDVDLAPPFLD